eukprot:PLAT11361.1.p1 GENE.PLAT11361.1~~PLAT11361.1.p1  ORF type:complete len:1912 (+),score=1152.22 PLAT11361.1:30-5738(+)
MTEAEALAAACSGHGSCLGSGQRQGRGRCACVQGWMGHACNMTDPVPTQDFRLASASFSASGALLLLRFSAAAKADAPPVGCEALLEDATAVVGDGCVAAWLSPVILQLRLGASATLLPVRDGAESGEACQPGQSVRLRGGVVWDVSNSKPAADDCVNAELPAAALLVDAMLSAPSFVGRCSPLLLDGRLSGGSTARAPKLRWSADWVDESQPAPLPLALRQSLQEATDQQASVLVVPQGGLPPGQAVRFTLELRSFLATSDGSSSSVVAAVGDERPTVAISGPPQRLQQVSEPLLLTAHSDFDGLCTEDGGDDAQQLSAAATATAATASTAQDGETLLDWSWRLLAGDWRADDGGTVVGGQELLVAADSLTEGVEYVWEVRVWRRTAPASYNAARVTVRAVGEGLQAYIAGGSRSIGADQELLLDASGSRDADGGTARLFFHWDCVQEPPVEGGAPLDVDAQRALELAATQPSLFCGTRDGKSLALTNERDAQLRVPAGTFSAGQLLRFTVTVLQDDGSGRGTLRSVSATVLVGIIAGETPQLSIDAPLTARLPEGERLRLRGAVTGGEEASLRPFAWSVLAGGLQLDVPGVRITAAGSLALALLPGALAGAPRYVFRLTSAAIGAVAQVEVVVNAAPTSGYVRVSPSLGQPLQPFLVEAPGWTDEPEDLPMSWRISASQLASTAAAEVAAAAAAPQLPLTGWQDVWWATLLLPGGGGAEAAVLLSVTISDALGATAQSSSLQSGDPAIAIVRNDMPAAERATQAALALDALPHSASAASTLQSLVLLATALRDSCDGIDCGGHGSCSGATAGCMCLPGWQGDRCEQLAEVTSSMAVWSQWSPWAACSASCGVGFTSRQRSCLRSFTVGSVSPSCVGDRDGSHVQLERQGCNTQACSSLGEAAVDGRWSDWSAWSSCSAPCDQLPSRHGLWLSQAVRTRSCSAPLPGPAGADCVGVAQQSRSCRAQYCTAQPAACPGRLPSGEQCSGHGSCQRLPAGCGGDNGACMLRCACVAGWSGRQCSLGGTDAALLQATTAAALARLASVSGADAAAANRDLQSEALVTLAREPASLTAASADSVLSLVEGMLAADGTDGLEEALLVAVGSARQAAADSSRADALLHGLLSSAAQQLEPGDAASVLRSDDLLAAVAVCGSNVDCTVSAASGQLAITAPAGLLPDGQLHVLLHAPDERSGGADGGVHAAAAISGALVVNLFDAAGRAVDVDQLDGMVELQLPLAGEPLRAQCAYWAHDGDGGGRWALDGIVALGSSTGSGGGGTALLRCGVTHFSTFAAVPEGAGDNEPQQVAPPPAQSRSLIVVYDGGGVGMSLLVSAAVCAGAAAAWLAARADARVAWLLSRLARLQFAINGAIGVPPQLPQLVTRLRYALSHEHLWLSLWAAPPEQLALLGRPTRLLLLAAAIGGQVSSNAYYYWRGADCSGMRLSTSFVATLLVLPLEALLPYAVREIRRVRRHDQRGKAAASRPQPVVLRRALRMEMLHVAPRWLALSSTYAPPPLRERAARLEDSRAVASLHWPLGRAMLALLQLCCLACGAVVLAGATALYYNSLLARDLLLPLTVNGGQLLVAVVLTTLLPASTLCGLAAQLLLHSAQFAFQWAYALTVVINGQRLPLLSDGYYARDWMELAAEAELDADLRYDLEDVQVELSCCGLSGPTDHGIGACAVDGSIDVGCGAMLPNAALKQFLPFAWLMAVFTTLLGAIITFMLAYLGCCPRINVVHSALTQLEARKPDAEGGEADAIGRIAASGKGSHRWRPGGPPASSKAMQRKRKAAATTLQRVWRMHNAKMGMAALRSLPAVQRSHRASNRALILTLWMLPLLALYVTTTVGVKYTPGKIGCWFAGSCVSLLLDACLQQPMLIIGRLLTADLARRLRSSARALHNPKL